MKSHFKKTFHESCKKIIRGNILELELKKKKETYGIHQTWEPNNLVT